EAPAGTNRESEGQAMRVVACLGLLVLCLGPVGCSLFKKQTAAAPTPRPGASGPTALAAAGPSARPSTPQTVGGLLAGQVIDSYNRRVQGSSIQIAAAKEGEQTAGAVIREVATDPQGFFTIQGLEPGKTYVLTARLQEGGHVLAGTSVVQPPNP